MTKIKVTKEKIEQKCEKIKVVKKKLEDRYNKNQGCFEKN